LTVVLAVDILSHEHEEEATSGVRQRLVSDSDRPSSRLALPLRQLTVRNAFGVVTCVPGCPTCRPPVTTFGKSHQLGE